MSRRLKLAHASSHRLGGKASDATRSDRVRFRPLGGMAGG